MKYLLLAITILFTSSVFGGSEVQPLSMTPDYSMRCMDGTFSYDTIQIKKTSSALEVLLSSGYHRSFLMNPQFFPNSMSGDIKVTVPLGKCVVAKENNSIITCAPQLGQVLVSLKNTDLKLQHTFAGQAQVSLNIGGSTKTYIHHDNIIVNRQVLQSNVAFRSSDDSFQGNFSISVDCLSR